MTAAAEAGAADAIATPADARLVADWFDSVECRTEHLRSRSWSSTISAAARHDPPQHQQSAPVRRPIRSRSYSSRPADDGPRSEILPLSPPPRQHPERTPPAPRTTPPTHAPRCLPSSVLRRAIPPALLVLFISYLFILERHSPLSPGPLPNAACYSAWTSFHDKVDSLVKHEIPDILAGASIITDLEHLHPDDSYLAIGDAARSFQDIKACPPVVEDIVLRTTLPACVPRRFGVSGSGVVPNATCARPGLAPMTVWERASAAIFLELCAKSSAFLPYNATQRQAVNGATNPSHLVARYSSYLRDRSCQLALPLASHSLVRADNWHVASSCPWDHAAKHALGHQYYHDDSVVKHDRHHRPLLTNPVRLATATQFTLASLRFDTFRISQLALLDHYNARIMQHYDLGLIPRWNTTRAAALDGIRTLANNLTIKAHEALTAHVEFVRECDVHAEDRDAGKERIQGMKWIVRHAAGMRDSDP